MKLLLNTLIRPIKEQPVFLFWLFVLLAAPDVAFLTMVAQRGISAVYVCLQCFSAAFLVTLCVTLVKAPRWRDAIEIALLLAAGFFFACNLYCVMELDARLDADRAILLKETRFSEACDFLATMIPARFIATTITVFAILILSLTLWHKHGRTPGVKFCGSALLLTVVALIASARNWRALPDSPIGRLFEIIHYNEPTDLRPYYSHPAISPLPADTVDFVLIIGESFARSHCSLYNYEKTTCPKLESLRDSGLLHVIDSVSSPAATTALALRKMLTTTETNRGEQSEWFRNPSIVELMQACGFRCYWFSNQSGWGKNNGTARLFANACDERHFLQREGSTFRSDVLDGVLVDSSLIFIDTLSQAKPNFVVYHMMGSHFDYSMRYPKSFDRFKPEDYADRPENQRKTLAAYDNSILYNDEVVFRLMQLYSDRNAIVIYLSDHGQDMFRSSDTYFAHGKDNDPASFAYGCEIPFLVYMTRRYQESHPEIAWQIAARQSQHTAWSSQNLIYFILHAIGVKEAAGQDTQTLSGLH